LTNFINYLLFVLKKFPSWKISPFFPFLFFFPSILLLFSLSSLLLPPSYFLPSPTASSHEQGDSTEQLGPSLPSCSPVPPLAVPPLLPPLSSPASSAMVPPMELQLRPWPPPIESSNQGRISSWDNQNGCTRPLSCYPHPQFYPKRTRISVFCGILVFN
jgi:hypothetical protein